MHVDPFLVGGAVTPPALLAVFANCTNLRGLAPLFG
jgi:hypothetical protein